MLDVHEITAVVRRRTLHRRQIYDVQRAWMRWPAQTRQRFVDSLEGVADSRIGEHVERFIADNPPGERYDAQQRDPGPDTPGDTGSPASGQPEPGEQGIPADAAAVMSDADTAAALATAATAESYVAGHPEHAQHLLGAELAGRARKTVVALLERAHHEHVTRG